MEKESEIMMIRFAQFVHWHQLSEEEIQDDSYLSDLLENFLEEYDN